MATDSAPLPPPATPLPIDEYKQLVESFAQAVWETDAHGQVITDSPSWRAYTGQPLEEWLGGEGWTGAIHPDDKAYALHQWQEAVRSQTPVNAEFRLHSPDEGWRWTNVRATRILEADGSVKKWVGLNIDIDERKKAQQALQQQQIRLEEEVIHRTAELQANQQVHQSTLDSSLEVIQVFGAIRDDRGQIVDFVWLLTNQAAQQQFGDVIGQRLLTHNPAVMETSIFDTFKRVVETGMPDQSERHYVHEQFNGWFYQSTVKLGDGVVTTTANLSPLKKAQEQLRSSHSLLQSIIDSSLDVIQVFNAIRDETGTIIDFSWVINNRKGMEQNGDVIGQSLLEHSPGVVESGVFARMVAVAQTGQPQELEQFYGYEQFDGWFYQTLVKANDGVVMTTHDITARKQAEQHQAYRLTLSDALRLLSDASAIEAAVTSEALRYFQADRCYYCTIEEGAGIIRRDAFRSGLSSIAGVYPLDQFDLFNVVLETGLPFVANDIHTADLVNKALLSLLLGVDIQSFLNVPVVKGEQVVGVFTLAQCEPRTWTEGEIAMAAETAERTWASAEAAKAEAALRHSEAHLATIFQAAQVGLSELDSEGRFLWVNDKLCQLLGRSPSALLNLSLLEVTHPADVAASLTTFGQVRQTGQPIAFDKRYLRANGELVWANSSLSLLPGTDGNRATMLAVTVDLTQRREAEEALRQSEERYRTLVENLPDYAIFRVDPDGLVSEWMEGAQQLTGYAADEMIGQPVSGLYTPQAQQAGEPADELREALRTGRAERESLRVRKTGERFWVNEITTAIGLESGQVLGFAKISRDISRRKRAQEARSQLEQRTRLAIEAADMATWEWHLAPDEVYWNDQHFRLLGMEPQPGPIPSHAFISRIHPDDRPWVTGELKRVIEQQTLFDVEFRVVRDDGVMRWMSGYGRVTKLDAGVALQLSGVMLDVTQRKAAEQALRQSEEKLRAILESAKDYAIFTTDLDQRVTSWNPGAQALFGYSAEDILQQSVNRLYTPQDRQQDIPRHEAQVAIQTGRFDNERWHSRQDGSLFYGSGVVTPLWDETGTLIGLLKVMRDLTAQKRAKEALKEADRRKDEFLAMLAHELRNPMSTIRSGLQILALTTPDEIPSGETVASTLVMMNRQTNHLVRMLDDLLDVSRISRGKIKLKTERVNLVDLVQQAIRSLQPQFSQQGKTLYIDLTTIPIQLLGDATRLTQVVTNLLTNGLRYTGDGGRVWLQVAQQSSPEGRTLAIIQVRDNGIGLAPDQLSSIFDLFVQVDNSTARAKGGLGLGLTLVKRLVELHGGWVEAQSQGLGQGSTFTVHLPMPVPVAAPTSTPTLQAIDSRATQRLLVIDDNADAAFTLATLLKINGYETHTRHSGRSGIDAAEELLPGAILLDIGMPELDGYATCRLIRQQAWGRNLVVIALTGYGQEEDRQRAQAAGFDGHLVKPVDLDALTKLLTDLLTKG